MTPPSTLLFITMQDPHPLAIIPLQRDLLLSDTSSNSSSSMNSSSHFSSDSRITASSTTSNAGNLDAPLVPVRALVPLGENNNAAHASSLRSEDDAALMRSLISLLPHEQADSQFSVTSPVRRTDADGRLRNGPWFRARPSTDFGSAGGDDGSSTCIAGSSAGAFCDGNGNGASDGGDGSRRGRAGCYGNVSSGAGGDGGLADGGLDFLGTTDSVRDLLHLPYTSDAVTVGLHRVGETLVLDGNLGEVLAPNTKTPSVPTPQTPASSASSGAGGAGGSSGRSRTASSANIRNASPAPADNSKKNNNGSSNNSSAVVGGSTEGRWVMVGRRGKPQRDEEPEAWEEERGGEGGGSARPRSTVSRVGQAQQRGGEGRGTQGAMRTTTTGWESTERGGGVSKRGEHRLGDDAADGGGDWSVHQASWPAIGAAAVPTTSGGGDDASSGSNSGILSIVPSRPRGTSFGAHPPEPAGFWRAFQWELGGMRLMLGSSLQVCSTTEHPQVSVRLHDGDEELSLCTCLDYYLDNVMENVPELALCMREKGYIQGCRLVSTEDIPYLGSLSRRGPHDATAAATAAGAQGGGAGGVGVGGSVPLFDPLVVELNATILLRFLQENCSREGGTYLLHRSEGAAHVQLYDVSALSRQRHRRWKWLLAMLCYRFAVRISHHTQQPWCRGGRSGASAARRGGRGSSSDAGGPVDVGPSPGPEVVRQLQRRQRQLLENSLELLEELAQLGGGGHETICASVQEHIADTYLGYGGGGGGGVSGGAQGTLSGGGSYGSTSTSDADNKEGWDGARRGGSGSTAAATPKQAPAAGWTGDRAGKNRGGVHRARQVPWTVDPNGGVWTSTPPPTSTQTPPSHATTVGAQEVVAVQSKRKGKRRGAGGTKSGAVVQENVVMEGGNFRQGGVRLGGDGGGTGLKRNSGLQTEEDLDKAQDHLTSGIAILRGVMARQESVAAGRDDSAADVVIVGESRRPVAVMRQTQQSPWRAMDDEEDEDEFVAEGQNHRGGGVVAVNGGGGEVEHRTEASRQEQQQQQQRQLQEQRSRRRRRGSRDESEDPATAMSVVSEQLWGLQRKLVGTYMAVARVRLSRAVPSPLLVATEAPVSGEGDRSLSSGVPGTTTTGGGSKKRGAKARGKLDGERRGGGGGGGGGECDTDDEPDVETRGECVGGALDSLCAAWEHMVEAMITLDRRAAGVLACKETAVDGRGDGTRSSSTEIGDNGCVGSSAQTSDDDNGGGVAGWPLRGKSSSDLEGRHARRGQGQGREEERSEGLGSLWKGSLSEALARSGGGSDRAESTAPNRGDGGAAGAGVDDGVGLALATRAEDGALGGGLRGRTRAQETEDDDAMGSQAWDRAARRKLAALRAELFELCGDVAHACVLLHSVNVRAGVGRGSPRGNAASAATGGGGSGGGGTDSLIGRLPGRLQELLSSARPALLLNNLDVCHGLHGRVWEALTLGLEHHDGNVGGDSGFVSRGEKAANKTNKRDRGTQRPADAESGGRRPSSSGGPRVARSSPEGGDTAAAATAEISVAVAQDDNVGARADPSPLAETCIHALTRAGHAPGDPTAWSLCLAVEACYKQALLDPDPDAGAHATTRGADVTGLTEPRARLMKKLGDASNELGKLMLRCAGILVQAPIPTASTTLPSPPVSTTHPGLGCAMCVACAELWFRQSLAGFRAVDDARNSALLLCNLASVERMKPRALARLREVCPAVDSGTMAVAGPRGGEDGGGGGGGGRGGGGRRGNGKKDGGSSTARVTQGGVQKAVELCGEAHAALGRREADPRTWDHASGELAMAYLCLGVERRQELLTVLVRPGEPGVVAADDAGPKGGSSTCSAPSVAQARDVVEPLERALQIYTDLQNAPQAAACHYQIGQYYAKVLPTYLSVGSTRLKPGASSPGIGFGFGSKSEDAGSATMRHAKAWEVGRKAARHFLAARAYFAPFEHGPTSVILALDLCDLYLRLASMGTASPAGSNTAAGGESPARGGSGGGGGGGEVTVPIPAGGGGAPGGGNEGGISQQRRPAAAIRLRCLEGALRSLLESRSVFVDADVDNCASPTAATAVTAAAAAGGASSAKTTPVGRLRLRCLLESVTQRLPKVMQALVRASVELEAVGGDSGGGGRTGDQRGQSTEVAGQQHVKRSAVFKSMYRRSLVEMQGAGQGGQAILAGLAEEYEAMAADNR